MSLPPCSVAGFLCFFVAAIQDPGPDLVVEGLAVRGDTIAVSFSRGSGDLPGPVERFDFALWLGSQHIAPRAGRAFRADTLLLEFPSLTDALQGRSNRLTLRWADPATDTEGVYYAVTPRPGVLWSTEAGPEPREAGNPLSWIITLMLVTTVGVVLIWVLRDPGELAGPQAPPASIGSAPPTPPLFSRPHPALDGIQRQVVRAVFRHMGVADEYIPLGLERLLRETDAITAVDAFLGQVGFSRRVLESDRDERRAFDRTVLVLARADEDFEAAELPFRPLFKSLKAREWGKAEGTAARAAQVARIRSRLVLDSPSVQYRTEFLPQASALLDRWSAADQNTMDEVEAAVELWQVVHREADRRVRHARARLIWEMGRIEKDGNYRACLVAMRERLEEHGREMRAGEITLAETIDRAQRILDDVVVLGAALAPLKDQPSDPDELRGPLHVLGLEYPVDLRMDLVKIAFRSKVRTLHPEHGGSLGSFCELVDAYEEVCEWFVSRRATGGEE